MKKVKFVTGNANKLKYLNQFFETPIESIKVELDEIQTLDILELVKHKVRQAYEIAKEPVLVEDVGLEFTAMGRLPGTFVKFFLQDMKLQDICDLLKGKERAAIAKCVFGYFDGVEEKYFAGSLKGKIAEVPAPEGGHGYGWDQIFIPEGYEVCRSQLSKEDDLKTYLQVKPIEKVKEFLEQ